MFCDEFHLLDLRLFENCKKVCTNVDHCFNLAADMGGMGFIQSNHSVIFYNNIMISFNIIEACRVCDVKRCFYASSACIYPEFAQLETTVEGGGLKESVAWPAQVRATEPPPFGARLLAAAGKQPQVDLAARILPFTAPGRLRPREALLRGGVQALPGRLQHPDPHCPLPQHLRPLRHLEGRPRESPGCLLPQDHHLHSGD
mmetsp:Transcript_29775/g.95763  ORF Transcript_29775/g.95763 Transcript_29775/m.95763 type:complete len:201 (+) Transcript_29775:326-928(+)